VQGIAPSATPDLSLRLAPSIPIRWSTYRSSCVYTRLRQRHTDLDPHPNGDVYRHANLDAHRHADSHIEPAALLRQLRQSLQSMEFRGKQLPQVGLCGGEYQISVEGCEVWLLSTPNLPGLLQLPATTG